jgi:hypothetical protein
MKKKQAKVETQKQGTLTIMETGKAEPEHTNICKESGDSLC